MDHKKQHFVPATYLKAWRDVNSPINHEPYVWVFPKNGGEPKNKPPKKIFWESDFYTIKKANEDRNLVLEHSLAKLETQFASLRDNKLCKRMPLTLSDKCILCTFTAAMRARTKARRNHWHEQWQQALDLGNEIAEWSKKASPEEVEQLSSALHPTGIDKSKSISMEEVEYIVENTIQSSLRAETDIIAPALFNMQFVIVDTLTIPTFITSDNPCVWFDPDIYENPVPFRSVGLNSPSIEISLPLSPTQCIFFGKKLVVSDLYVPIQSTDPITDELNYRTWAYSDEFFIYNQKETKFSWHTKNSTK